MMSDLVLLLLILYVIQYTVFFHFYGYFYSMKGKSLTMYAAYGTEKNNTSFYTFEFHKNPSTTTFFSIYEISVNANDGELWTKYNKLRI